MKKYELVNFCEFDKYATKSYCAVHNIDESKNLGDINDVDEKKLEYFNMITGGSPCQSFSVAGRQEGYTDETIRAVFEWFMHQIKNTENSNGYTIRYKGVPYVLSMTAENAKQKGSEE